MVTEWLLYAGDMGIVTIKGWFSSGGENLHHLPFLWEWRLASVLPQSQGHPHQGDPSPQVWARLTELF